MKRKKRPRVLVGGSEPTHDQLHLRRRGRAVGFAERGDFENVARILADWGCSINLVAKVAEVFDERGYRERRPVRESFDVDYKGRAEYHVRLRWNDSDLGDGRGPEPSWVDFEIVAIAGHVVAPGGGEGDRLYAGENHPTSLDDADFAIRGFVKWDGCTQFWVECGHVDDAEDLDVMLGAIRMARQRAILAMGPRFDRSFAS